MNELMSKSLFCGLILSIGCYWLGERLKHRTGKAWCNPLLTACVCVIFLLAVTKVSYTAYQTSVRILTDLLTPATVCLAIPLYKQFRLFRENAAAVLAGILSGILATFICVIGVTILFRLSRVQYVTLLPKSVTTAIGMVLSEENGGIPPVTVAAILLTGVWGNMTAPLMCRLLHINDPVAKGIAIGASSHIIGTTRAIELGEIEGAMSSLSTVVSGLLTAAVLPAIIGLY